MLPRVLVIACVRGLTLAVLTLSYLWPSADRALGEAASAAVLTSGRTVDALVPGASYPGLMFPLAGTVAFDDTFGDPRGGGRTHEGIDIAAPKLTPVRAAAAGTVAWMHDERGGRCCDVELQHDDGWRSRYIHLNNDTPGTDDGEGWGFVDGLRAGSRVEAGDLLGWVGDSGNAEHVGPHLHFELRRPDGRAVNPHAVLGAARDRMPLGVPREAPTVIAKR